MNAIVTGGAGFLGSHLCERLLKNGDYVYCIDNLITGSFENVKHLSGNIRFKFIQEDIISFNIENISIKPDIIFHLASPASPPDYMKFPLETLRVNSIGTDRCLSLAKKAGARFLFTSTSEVYGDPLVHPQKETYWGNVNPVGPRSVYDEGKRYGEALVMAYHRQYGLKTYLPRIFNTYGPRMRLNDGRVIPNFISQILSSKPLTIYGDGKQTRSFCYVDDLISAFLLLIETDYHLPVNLGNPEEFTIIELAEKMKKLSGADISIKFLDGLPDDPKQRKPDITLAKKILGWFPTIKLEEGLKKTLDYYIKVKK
ncbi:MAG TPA: SDR family oxidoreductase [Candidatus Ratteibacteria bacterium]|jgi:dTDP-glucose 4,6-dehydratase|uniref:UDP-glucose 4-epimerase n=1 Tax=candidate division TA06 bacterium ADurb.Bin131 TaxID=1852827 RepID=A0A1V6C4I3_UNCT6|nr:MAG: UDP-glucose 4-epimerase [candidate division TA06 bacterium ADurb.Bin131]HON05032.1 SDR family oxidoreductase [bacterium]HPC29568.1 SDR family oxidoreductase [bacterium]HRS05862.1 SDR family oxidoreductase [Candidatus Ratteibacteria bacterium]HRV03657.1 SDR family oxidoreductase [Candidatus Ratteibacteria bacterium]